VPKAAALRHRASAHLPLGSLFRCQRFELGDTLAAEWDEVTIDV
jgi:hypothetical protein